MPPLLRRRFIRRLLLASFAGAMPIAACAAGDPNAAPKASAPVSEFEFRLQPGQSERICLKLERGKGLDFRFDTDAPLDFDIRQKVGAKTTKPWDAPAVMHQVGRFVARRAGEHCMTWTAGRYEAGVLGKWQPYAKR